MGFKVRQQNKCEGGVGGVVGEKKRRQGKASQKKKKKESASGRNVRICVLIKRIPPSLNSKVGHKTKKKKKFTKTLLGGPPPWPACPLPLLYLFIFFIYNRLTHSFFSPHTHLYGKKTFFFKFFFYIYIYIQWEWKRSEGGDGNNQTNAFVFAPCPLQRPSSPPPLLHANVDGFFSFLSCFPVSRGFPIAPRIWDRGL